MRGTWGIHWSDELGDRSYMEFADVEPVVEGAFLRLMGADGETVQIVASGQMIRAERIVAAETPTPL
jgi:hypothetical protein